MKNSSFNAEAVREFPNLDRRSDQRRQCSAVVLWPGAIVLADTPVTSAGCEVVNLVDEPTGRIVRGLFRLAEWLPTPSRSRTAFEVPAHSKR